MAKTLKYLLLLLFTGSLITIVNCNSKHSKKEIPQINPEKLIVERFEQEFHQLNSDKLKILKQKYPYLLPENQTDIFWMNKSKDTLQQEILKEVNTIFKADFSKEKKALEQLFGAIKHYFPETPLPKIITLTNDVDYKNNILLTPEYLLLSLDCFLGTGHHFYQDIPKFICKDFSPEKIPYHVALKFAQQKIKYPDARTFLSQMILYGKRLFLVEQLLASYPQETITNYSSQELKWAEENETFIWRYFVEKEFLFSTDKTLFKRFIYPAPFSKFYLQIDSESPDRLGVYIGYQIVKNFNTKYPEISLEEILNMDSTLLFNKSNYKPNK